MEERLEVKKKLEDAYEQIVEVVKCDLGYNTPEDLANLMETAERCKRALLEFIYPKVFVDEIVHQYLDRKFPSENDEMIVKTDIRAISLCPHHLLPVEMSVNIGYIPKKYVLGISKLARIAKMMAKQPLLQEDYTSKLAQAIYSGLDCKGVGVYVNGVHGCMKFRGVLDEHGNMVTSKLLGNFQLQATREEFLSLCRMNNGK